MSDRLGLLTETELDALLGRWLSQGATLPSDRVVERALRRVATVPQEGARLRGIRTVFGRAPLAWAAVAAAALLIGIGVFLGRGLVGDTPSPSPSAEESDGPIPQLLLYTNPEDGYQLALPPSWAENASTILNGTEPYRGLRKFGTGGPSGGYPALTISIGEPDGSVYLCRYGWRTSVPADESCEKVVVRTLDELGALLVSNRAGSTESHGDTMLAGLPARFESFPLTSKTCDGCPGALYHVFTIRGGRPVVLAFNYWNVDFSRDRLQLILDSFRFLDPTAGEPLPEGMTTRTLFDLRFDVPGRWRVSFPQGAVTYDGGSVDLTVRFGDEHGNVQACDAPAGAWEVCQAVQVTTLDELVEAVAPQAALEQGMPVPGTVTEETLNLDGEVAHRTNIEGYEYPAKGAEHVTYLVLFHSGQPIILRLHTTAESPPPVWEEILASVRFRDEGPSTTPYMRFGLQFDVPAAWTVTTHPHETSFSGELTVREGSMNGEILTCDTPAGPWEVCQVVTAQSLEELADAVTPHEADEHGVGVPGRVTIREIHIDGEPAIRTDVEAYEYPARGAEHVTYVVAFRSGRPLILRFHTTLETPPATWDDILATARFPDCYVRTLGRCWAYAPPN